MINWSEVTSKIAFVSPLIVLFCVGGLFYLDKKDAEITVSQTKVGIIESVEVIPGSLFDKTMINTTKGAYVVEGIYSAAKGIEAIVETRKNDSKYFCLTGNKCVLIAE